MSEVDDTVVALDHIFIVGPINPVRGPVLVKVGDDAQILG